MDEHRYRDLFDARSVVGAVVVIGILSLFGFGLQALSDSLQPSSEFAVGEPTPVTPLVTVTPADGWAIDRDQSVPDFALVARNDGWEIKISGGIVLEPDQTVADLAGVIHDIPPEDPGTVVTDLTTFTTTSGSSGVTWQVNGPTTTEIHWWVASGTNAAQILADGPTATLKGVETDLDAMAESITIADTPAPGASE